jgi:hypothetical protein
MTQEDWKRLEQHLTALPQHTPLKMQIDLLRDDVLKLVAEVMRLRNEAHAAKQPLERDAHAAGGEAMRQACLEVACIECTANIIRLSVRPTAQ